jgi:hypothetical protein
MHYDMSKLMGLKTPVNHWRIAKLFCVRASGSCQGMDFSRAAKGSQRLGFSRWVVAVKS